MDEPFYITTPIYYVNDEPHLGHAYTTIIADVLARYHRCRGEKVFFLTGTDEHGQKIERAAQAKKEKPIELANRVVSRFKETWGKLNIRYDHFIRTTERQHAQAVQALWQRMAEASEGQPMEFLSTHPSHETRISDLQSWIPEAMAIYQNAPKAPVENLPPLSPILLIGLSSHRTCVHPYYTSLSSLSLRNTR